MKNKVVKAAIFLCAFFFLTSCRENAVQSEDIIVLLTEPELMEQTLVSDVSEELTDITAAETLSETVMETEKTTVQEYEVISADTLPESVVGRWIENRLYEYIFDSGGNVTLSSSYFTLNGTYAVSDSELEVIIRDSSGKDRKFRFSMSAEPGGYKLERLYDEVLDGKYIPCEPTGLADGYFSAFGGEDVFHLSSPYEEPVPAQQKDVIGSWQNSSGVVIEFSDDSICVTDGLKFRMFDSVMEDGMIYNDAGGIYAEFMLYKGILYYPSEYFDPDQWKRCELPETLPLNGNYHVYTYPEKYIDLDLELEYSKGTAEEVVESENGISVITYEAEIAEKDGKYIFIRDGETTEYTFITVNGSYTYFYSENEVMILKKDLTKGFSDEAS